MVKKIEVNGKFYKRTKPKEDGFCLINPPPTLTLPCNHRGELG